MRLETSEPILITQQACHYCEKARWALDRARIPYREKHNRPFVEWSPATPRSIFVEVPKLITKDKSVSGPTKIVRWVDEQLAADDRLFPKEPALRAEVEEWVSFFAAGLGPQMRLLVLWFAVEDRRVLMSFVEHNGSGPLMVRWLGLIFPLLAPVARRRLKLTEAAHAKALNVLEESFRRVNDRLADGRRYLVGERFTAADLTFAAYAATLLSPPGSHAPMPPAHELTKQVRDAMAQYRHTRAGEFVFRMYEEHRRERIENSTRLSA